MEGKLAEQGLDGGHDSIGLVFAHQGTLTRKGIRKGDPANVLEALRFEVQHGTLNKRSPQINGDE
jgi:hypothetical protein